MNNDEPDLYLPTESTNLSIRYMDEAVAALQKAERITKGSLLADLLNTYASLVLELKKMTELSQKKIQAKKAELN